MSECACAADVRVQAIPSSHSALDGAASGAASTSPRASTARLTPDDVVRLV